MRVPSPPQSGAHDAVGAIAEFLQARGWTPSACERCGIRFFARPGRERCGRQGCGGLEGTRAGLQRPRSSAATWRRARSHFRRLGFTTFNRCDIANPPGRSTQFVGAGLQIFEDAIDAAARPPVGALFVPQPVVRLNYFDEVGRTAGVSTSFLNLCSEQINAGIDDHLHHLSAWLGCLRALGLPADRVTIVPARERWRGGPYAGGAVTVEVSGVEVGDAIFVDEGPAGAESLLPIADFSFGLERLTWASGGEIPYRAVVGPLPESALPGSERTVDRLRTATLLCLAGVTPSSTRHGRALRRLVSDAVGERIAIDVGPVVAHAHRHWTSFIPAVLSVEECQRIVRTEWQRARGIALSRALLDDASPTRGAAEPPDEICWRFLREGMALGELAEQAARAPATDGTDPKASGEERKWS